MARGAPFAECNQIPPERIEQPVLMYRKPLAQPGELACMPVGQVMPPILGQQDPLRRNRESQIRAIQFFFDHHGAGEEFGGFRWRQHLVIARRTFPEPGEMGRVRETKEFAHSQGGKAGTGLPGNFFW